jgi:hypothetical protein
MYRIFFITAILILFNSSAGDTIQVLKSGDTVIAKTPAVILSQSQFQKVVSDKQELKTDSLQLAGFKVITSNDQIKDSLYNANSKLQDSITEKYKTLYEASAKEESKLKSVPWYKDNIVWFILGSLIFYLAAEAQK